MLLAVHERIANCAERSPDALAILDGDREVTFAELQRMRTLAAGGLRQRGVGRGDRVVLWMPCCAELVAALLGILDIGAAFVPVDPGHPEMRNALVAEHSGARLVLTGRDADGDGPENALGWHELVDGRGPGEPVAAFPGDLAYVLYTSGSTGTPKGVRVAHRAIANYIDWSTKRYEMDRGSGAPLHTSVAFDLTLTTLLGPLAVGRPIVVFPQPSPIEVVAAVADALRTRPGWSFLKATPAHVRLLAALLAEEDLRGAARILVVGGEQLTGADVAAWRAIDPGSRVINEYGPTEAAVGCAAYEVPPDTVPDGPVAIGRAIPGARISLHDASGRAVAHGEAGELHVAGVCLADGYHGGPAETALQFRPAHGGGPGERAYATGDLCREREDGEVVFVGRVDDQVSVGGHRVELDEVAGTLAAHPSVREATAVLAPSRAGRRVLVGFVVLAADATLAADELRGWVEGRLPAFMTPVAVHQVAAMPLAASGKVDRDGLISLAAEREPVRFATPRTLAERFLSEAASELLGTPVGAEDDLLEFGFDSILAIQLVHRARLAGYWVTPGQVLERPSVAALARAAVVVGPRDAGPDTRSQSRGNALTAAQSWFFDLDLATPDEFHQAVVIHASRPLDAAAFAAALRAVVGAHEALRTAYESGAPAVVEPPAEIPVTMIDVQGLDADQSGGRIDAHVASAQSDLSIANGDMLRGAVANAGTEAWIVLVIHHLAVDGISWTILLEDLAAAYHAIITGRESGLAATSQLAAAARLDRLASSSAVVASAPAWLAIPAGTGVRRDRGKADLAAETADVTVSLEPTTTRELLANTLRVPGRNMGAAVLAATVAAVSRWTGDGLVVADMEGHGRDDIAAECGLARTVGWFTALYPVAVDVTSCSGDLLAAAAAALGRSPHKGVSYGLLRYRTPDANLRRALAVGRGPQLLVNYLGATRSQLSPELGWERMDSRPLAGMGPAGIRPYALEVQARLVGRSLTTSWIFSSAALERETVVSLATTALEALERMATERCGAATAR